MQPIGNFTLSNRSAFAKYIPSEHPRRGQQISAPVGQNLDYIVIPQKRKACNRVGRPALNETLMIRNFLRDGAPPKKENLRCRMIRGLKKAIRLIHTGINPRDGSTNLVDSTHVSTNEWQILTEHFKTHSEILNNFCQPQNGPNTDGRNKRSGKGIFNTYNNRYIKNIFQTKEIRRAYRLFIDVIFAAILPDSLNQKFNMRCCDSEHSEVWHEKWEGFKEYLKKDIVEQARNFKEGKPRKQYKFKNPKKSNASEPLPKTEDLEVSIEPDKSEIKQDDAQEPDSAFTK